jgi:PIN domain nuclease of toxin-antitoxin system
MLFGEKDKISQETQSILSDYNCQLYVSIIAVNELLQLWRIGKVKSKKFKSANDLVKSIETDLLIKIEPFSIQNLEVLSKLIVSENHNDPFDHAIISQAISDKLTLISSDTKFKHYTSQKLKFVFNKR